MNPQLTAIKKEYENISAELSSPEIFNDPKKMASLGKRQSELAEMVGKIDELEKINHGMKGNAEIINTDDDPEMKQMAMEENIGLSQRLSELEKEIEILLLPKDPNDDKNIIVEIRGGAGGGTIIATGTPEEVAKVKKSFTGQYLNDILKRDKKREKM